jgi:hypothetical protein
LNNYEAFRILRVVFALFMPFINSKREGNCGVLIKNNFFPGMPCLYCLQIINNCIPDADAIILAGMQKTGIKRITAPVF